MFHTFWTDPMHVLALHTVQSQCLQLYAWFRSPWLLGFRSVMSFLIASSQRRFCGRILVMLFINFAYTFWTAPINSRKTFFSKTFNLLVSFTSTAQVQLTYDATSPRCVTYIYTFDFSPQYVWLLCTPWNPFKTFFQNYQLRKRVKREINITLYTRNVLIYYRSRCYFAWLYIISV